MDGIEVTLTGASPDCRVPDANGFDGRKGYEMARRRYQRGSLVSSGDRWILRWREDEIGDDGQIRRIARKTFVGTKGEFPTKKLARRRADLIVAPVNSLDYRPGRTALFMDFANRWFENVGKMKKLSTQGKAKQHLDKYLRPRFGKFSLEQIHQEEVQGFVSQLAGKMKRHSIMNILGTLSSILKTAKSWGYMTGGFDRSSLVLPLDRVPKRVRYFSADDARRILSIAPEPWRSLFATLAMTGIRGGEVFALTIEDLDFERRTISIRRSAWQGKLQLPKSARSVRTLPLPAPLAEILRRHLATSWIPNELGLVFCTRRGTPLNTNKVVVKRLWPILDELQIDRCGLHAFRHTASSLLVSLGAQVTVVRDQLGHSDTRTTLEIYSHVVGEDHRIAAEKLASLLCLDVSSLKPKSMILN